MDWETIGGLIARHAFTTLGGALASHGIIQASATDGFVGACMVLTGVAWSAWTKYGKALVDAQLAKLHGLK